MKMYHINLKILIIGFRAEFWNLETCQLFIDSALVFEMWLTGRQNFAIKWYLIYITLEKKKKKNLAGGSLYDLCEIELEEVIVAVVILQ